MTIFGLGSFGKSILTHMARFNVETLVFDRNEETIASFKHITPHIYLVDVRMRDEILRILPEKLDTVVIDLGGETEATLKVLLTIKKRKPERILVRAEDPDMVAVYEKFGVDQVIIPSVEAAKRITPLLVSQLLFNFIPLSAGLVMAEITVPNGFQDKTLRQLDIRNKHGLNVVAIKASKGEYELFDIDRRMEGSDILLVVGKEDNLLEFIGKETSRAPRPLHAFLDFFFKKKP